MKRAEKEDVNAIAVQFIHCEARLWIGRCASLGIRCAGTTLGECLRAFEDEVDFLWATYAMEDDARLSSDAQALKRTLLRLFLHLHSPGGQPE